MKHNLDRAFSPEETSETTESEKPKTKGLKNRFSKFVHTSGRIARDLAETRLHRKRLEREIEKLTPLTFAELQQSVREQPTDALDTRIENMTDSFSSRNETELYSTGPEAFAEIERQIDQATTSISINIFSWSSDSTGMRLAQKIAEAKEKNPDLKITVHIDKMGCFFNGTREGIQKNILEFAKNNVFKYIFKYPLISTRKLINFAMDANAAYDFSSAEKKQLESFIREILTEEELVALNPSVYTLLEALGNDLIIKDNGIENMDHSKVYIFDNAMIMSGGMNIGDNYSGGYDEETGWSGEVDPNYWRDYMVKTKGPAAAVGRNMFFDEDTFSVDNTKSPDGSIPIRVLKNKVSNPDEPLPPDKAAKIKQITYGIFEMIESAEQSIVVEHAYIMDQHVVDKLIAAAKRGVDVTIIRGLAESSSLARANETFFRQMKKVPGITILDDNRVIHTKLIRTDDQYSMIGSANLSRTSLWDHEEVSLFIAGDNPMQQQIREQVQKTISRLQK